MNEGFKMPQGNSAEDAANIIAAQNEVLHSIDDDETKLLTGEREPLNEHEGQALLVKQFYIETHEGVTTEDFIGDKKEAVQFKAGAFWINENYAEAFRTLIKEGKDFHDISLDDVKSRVRPKAA